MGLATKVRAPEFKARSRASSVEMTHTGMCRVARSFLSRSRTRQPSISGRKMSSVRTLGLYSRASARRRSVRLRQMEREIAPLAGEALQTNLASQQPRQLAANGQAQARPAIFAAGAAVCLLERFEDDLLLLRRDADAGIRHGEGE